MTAPWLDIPEESPFPIENLPYGVFRRPGEAPRVGVAVGEHVLDLAALAGAGLLDEVANARAVFSAPALNPFMALGRDAWRACRRRLTELLTGDAERGSVEPALVRARDVELQLPFAVADYVDFYASLDHATNLGKLFRPGSDPLLPN